MGCCSSIVGFLMFIILVVHNSVAIANVEAKNDLHTAAARIFFRDKVE
jgi:hypothetical protein